jgi:DNA-binding XRE family transcriptional regulator/predicted GIY-YIG superfamily endonuclease
MNDERTALYRLFDEANRLLYVGITANPTRRWYGHASMSIWWGEVLLREIEWFPSRTEALAREAAEIAGRRPRYNRHPGYPEPSAKQSRLTKKPVTPGEEPRPRVRPTIEEVLERADQNRVKGKRDQFPSPSERSRVRKAYGLTQADMAQVLRVHRITVSSWERGVYDPVGRVRMEYLHLFAHMKKEIGEGEPEVVAEARE